MQREAMDTTATLAVVSYKLQVTPEPGQGIVSPFADRLGLDQFRVNWTKLVAV